jgi:hypothetical protein
MAPSAVFRSLRRIYLVSSACALLRSVEAVLHSEVSTEHRPASGSRGYIPDLTCIKRLSPSLLDALDKQDGPRAVDTLIEMHVFELCPNPRHPPIDQLERAVDGVIGDARIIVLIELAYCLLDFDAANLARLYINEARVLAAGASEKHELHTLRGMIAVGDGDIEVAQECLVQSISVCNQNEAARFMSGIRPFSLRLAEALLGKGKTDCVIEYLSSCREIWPYSRNKLDGWIAMIRDGIAPDYTLPDIRNALDEPALKLRSLSIRASVISEMLEIESMPSGHPSLPDVKKVLVQWRSRTQKAIRGELGTSVN